MKVCSKCKIEKDFNEFHRCTSNKSGYKSACKDCESQRRKNYYENNKEKELERGKNYCKKNRYIKNEYVRNRRKNDNLFRLTLNIRTLIGQKIRNGGYTKRSKTNDILGCSYEEFKNYLESRFETWMNWDNYGKYNGELNYGWDIDHIIPVGSSITEKDLIKLNHYTNLQPLCSKINRDIKINNLEYGNV